MPPGQVWHLPNDPHTRTTRQLVHAAYQHAGRSRSKLRTVPPLLLTAMGLVNPTIRELVEMQYQFQEPFIVDSSKITTKLGVIRPRWKQLSSIRSRPTAPPTAQPPAVPDDCGAYP